MSERGGVKFFGWWGREIRIEIIFLGYFGAECGGKCELNMQGMVEC